MELAKYTEHLLAEVKEAIAVFGALQEEHHSKLKAGNMHNFSKWSDCRSRAMGRLQQALSEVWQCDSLQRSDLLGEKLRDDIGLIIIREQKLAKEASRCLMSLDDNISTMRRGKKALGGYGGTPITAGSVFRNTF